jgi:hypothetical protein
MADRFADMSVTHRLAVLMIAPSGSGRPTRRRFAVPIRCWDTHAYPRATESGADRER